MEDLAVECLLLLVLWRFVVPRVITLLLLTRLGVMGLGGIGAGSCSVSWLSLSPGLVSICGLNSMEYRDTRLAFFRVGLRDAVKNVFPIIIGECTSFL